MCTEICTSHLCKLQVIAWFASTLTGMSQIVTVRAHPKLRFKVSTIFNSQQMNGKKVYCTFIILQSEATKSKHFKIHERAKHCYKCLDYLLYWVIYWIFLVDSCNRSSESLRINVHVSQYIFQEHDELVCCEHFILRIDLRAAEGGSADKCGSTLRSVDYIYGLCAHVEALSQCNLEIAYRSCATLHHEKPSQWLIQV